ncbi:asparagine synthetase B family protein [Roseovarius aquimarinus]|uniref:asparagine synthase (glutamine-hydrolyzing) n=1 Tax=Roseovarius aquimarinus TaxID=1229156 RepID=A0ABW7I4F2_9RHOB
MTIGADPPLIWLDWGQGAPVMSGCASWRSGPDLPARIGRLYAAWKWDGTRLRAEVDRHGFHSLFVYRKGDTIAISPSLLALVAAGADPAPDTRALAVFHRIGVFINDDTPLRHVRTLPPNGRLEWREGRLEITGGTPIPKVQSITREGALEGMTAHFREAMRRILDMWDEPLTLPLSGGRDSRHILLEMLHQGRRPRSCITFHHNGAAMNGEALAARALAERAGIAHDVAGHARPRLADALRCAVMTSLCADEHAQMMPLHDYMLARGGAAFDGIAGDILTNPDNDAEAFFRLAEKGDFTGIARGLCEGHGRVISEPGWGRGAGPILSPGMDEEVHDYLGETIAAYADAPDPYQVFWMYHRTRREINFVPQAILAPATPVFCPYLDPDFAEFCLSLPYAVTCDQMLHDDVIARAYPDFADIPYAAGFRAPAPQGGGAMHKLRGALDVMRITAAMGPRAKAERRAFLRPPGQLKRGPDMALRLHALCLDGLDAARARRLLDLAGTLEAARPRRLISDSLPERAP